MKKHIVIHPDFLYLQNEIMTLPERFEREGNTITAIRNTIKIINIGGIPMNVKSFKIPHLINRIAYAYLRPSKAERSYKYANILLAKGISTPQPVAYIVFQNIFGITQSYYISLQENFDFEFRDLRKQNPPDMEKILREFTRFTWNFHQQGIYFIDHSPGNTLISRTQEHYNFSLVDLNRIKFTKISPRKGLRNFYRLNATDSMIDVIADEYAHLTHSNPAYMSSLLKKWTHQHDEQVMKRNRKKKRQET